MSGPSLPDVDFARIRSYGQPASRAAGFEELASILIQQGGVQWAAGTRFERFGNPDGGREGRGILPNGDVWAWQVKYVFEFDSSTIGQIEKSVNRALEREPALRRYFVVLPIDLPAGDTAERTSAHTRWATKVSEWRAAAAERGIDVDVVLLGAHELLTTLTDARHAGRVRYWFDSDMLAPEWQARRVEEALARAGRRYTPKLHVEVDTVKAVFGACRSPEYIDRWQQVLATLRDARRWGWRAPAGGPERYGPTLAACSDALDTLDAGIAALITAARSPEPLPSVEAALEDAQALLGDVDEWLYGHSQTDGYFVGDAATLYTAIRLASEAVGRGRVLVSSAATRAAASKQLLLTGRAGTGKTHLLCDIASRRTAAGLPTVLVFGQDFEPGALLPQLVAATGLGSSLDDALSVLNAAAEAVGELGLLIVDALNESERPERWKDDLRALMAAARRYSHIAVVVSCRTEFVDNVVGHQDIAKIEHVGFAESAPVALRRFAHEYGLELPTFPVLNPEFGNPLVLKLTCEALATLGTNRFVLGAAGLDVVREAFLEAVNVRLAESSRCDYDEHDNLVKRAVAALADLDQDDMAKADVERVVEVLLPGRSWSRSLLRGLLDEGVLLRLSDGRFTFGYQRLGDLARADRLCSTSAHEVQKWLAALGDDAWRHQGVLGALAVLLPERLGVEIVDLALDDEKRVSYDVIDSFLESLVLRSPVSTSARTAEIVERLLDDSYRSAATWDQVFRVSCVPRHQLNADWLHTRLSALDLATRDETWSQQIVGYLDEETPIAHLLLWAWPRDVEDGELAPADDVVALATKLFGWLLTTTDRALRDHATKAIAKLGEQAPGAFAQSLSAFAGVDDPYVVERLTAAACAVVLRNPNPATSTEIADALQLLIGDQMPTHLLTRDYVRRAFQAAGARGWTGPDAAPPYGTSWPISTRSFEEIQALISPPESEYSSVWHSLSGWGDFSRYIIEPALRKIACDDRKALQHDVERAIFDRVLELGWTPERFWTFDQRRRSASHDPKVERIGKKYQWIGFYEVLGRIADNFAIKPDWREEGVRYQSPEQLIWRDIDPTALARRQTRIEAAGLWFSPAQARFSEAVQTYPDSMDGVPDPLDLITVTDPTGVPCLALASRPAWEEPLAPEIEVARPPKRRIWLEINAYVVRTVQVATIAEWAKGKDWFGRWMPTPPDIHNVLLGSFPDDPAWHVTADDMQDWWGHAAAKPAADLSLCAAWYAGTGTSRDESGADEARGYVPSRELASLLAITDGKDFVYSDSTGVALWDPSARAGGPATLVMRRELATRLADAGLTLFWTVLIGNERYGDGVPQDDYRWVNASASYVLESDRIKRIDASAHQDSPGPTIETRLAWQPKSEA